MFVYGDFEILICHKSSYKNKDDLLLTHFKMNTAFLHKMPRHMGLV